jgi:hypothetical protein
MSPLQLSQQFPSLAIPLQSSRVLGVYFASSWCMDCVPVTPQLKTFYNKASTLPFKSMKSSPIANCKDYKYFEVVYVSSDINANQMEEYYKTSHASWSFVPYSNSDELKALKRYFHVCAGREAPGLGMTGPGARLSGIPTLLLLDTRTEQIISRHGVEDILQLSVDDAFQKWDHLLA